MTVFQFALPDNEYSPTLSDEGGDILFIAGSVFFYLFAPERGIGLGQNKKRTPLMPMPETTVDEYHTLVFWKDNVRAACQTPVIGPISEPFFEQEAPDEQFNLGILASNGSHDLTSLSW